MSVALLPCHAPSAGGRLSWPAIALVAFLAIVVVAEPLRAAPPRVVKATPDDGDEDVNPGLEMLEIEFDQDMAGGMSLCGVQEADVAGKPRWKTKRIFEGPLKLQPGQNYAWSVNCPKANNFRSAAGEPAAVYPLRFRTAAADAKQAAPPTLAEKQAAVERLRKVVDERYAYRDLRRPDWQQIFGEHTPRLTEAATWSKFAKETARLLGAARDMHIMVQLQSGNVLPSFIRRVQTNFDLDQVRAQLPELKQHNRTVFSGKFPDGIGYILIGTWSQPADMEAAYEALREFADAPGLIVDVRPNAGGNELLARDFAGCFHRQGAIYSRNATRDPAQPSGFSEVYDRRVEPNAKRPAIAVPVAVLMGPANMSSCESFLLMMRAAPNVKLVGDRSFGSSGNPKPHDIGGGITVFLPSWKDYLPDGTLLEGRGIDPDISVPPGNDDPTDAVLDVALAQLRKK